jgi:hypothetical protein
MEVNHVHCTFARGDRRMFVPRYLGIPPFSLGYCAAMIKAQQSPLRQSANMAPASLLDLVSALPATDGWGPAVSSETMLDGVPFAPYSKGDKLGRMADWTEGKDRERGGRQQYGNRNYRGMEKSRQHVRKENMSI